MGLEIGLKYISEIEITPKLTVPGNADKFHDFGDMPPVFATAMMVGFIENTAIAAIKPFLEEGQQSLGTLVNFTHIAPTPIGMKARAEVELIEINGRRLVFKVIARDEQDIICEGIHERAIINSQKFLEKLATKVPK